MPKKLKLPKGKKIKKAELGDQVGQYNVVQQNKIPGQLENPFGGPLNLVDPNAPVEDRSATPSPQFQFDNAGLINSMPPNTKDPYQNGLLGAGQQNRQALDNSRGMSTRPLDPVRAKLPRNDRARWYGSYEASMAASAFNEGARNKQLAKDSTGDLNHQYKVRAAGNNIEGAGHVILDAFDKTKGVLGFIGGQRQFALGKKAELESQLLAKRSQLEQTGPYRLYGDNSELGGGTNDVLAKYGAKLPMYEYGGQANVMYERGETISRPSGEVEHITYGDEHSDPSGGIKAYEEPGTVIHSKETKVKVGDLLDYSSNFPGGDFVNLKIMEKYKNPDKEISYADAAKVFKTDPLEKQVLTIKKKATKEETYADNMNETKISQTTSKLNLKTLAKQLQEKEQEIAMNVAVTGPEGPLYNMSEDLKRAGEYGKEAKESTKKAKFGTLINKNIRMAAKGDAIPTEGVEILGNPDSDGSKTVYKFKNGKWTAIKTVSTDGNTTEIEGYDLNPVQSKEVNDFWVSKQPPSQVSNPVAQAAANVGFDPSDITDFRTRILYPGDKFDSPNADQKAFGAAGWNKSPFQGTPKEAMEMLTNAGFKPKDGKWKDTQPEDIQEFLYDLDSKNPQGKFSVLKNLFEDFKNTEQGRQYLKDNNLDSGTTFDELGDTGVKEFFKDDKYGIRTGLATAVLGSMKPKAPVTQAPVAPAAATQLPTFNVNATARKNRDRGLYSEGLNPWQIVGEMGVFADRYEPAPYIEDTGAKDAFAMGSKPRYTDIQPQLNRITRGLQAQTRFRDSSPNNQAFNTQAAANAYEAANQVYGQKYNADAQIDANFDRTQQELRLRAGANKAQALDLLAQRTAKGHSAYGNRLINAASSIGNKFVQNQTENRASMLYQDMFPAFDYNPVSGGTVYSGNYTPRVGVAREDTMARLSEGGKYDVSQTINADGTVSYTRKAKAFEAKKYGGKVSGKLPKKLVKKVK